METTLEKIKRAYEEALGRANSALSCNPVDYEGYTTAMSDLEKAEKDYAAVAAITMYDEYAKKDNPIIEIIKAYCYVALGHKEERNKEDDNRVVAVKSVTKERRVDLLEFCKRAGLDTTWKYAASKFNQLMCMRVAKDLGADLDKVATSYLMEDIAKAVDLGETPTSNTQVCKALQQVIDEMIPNEDENGKRIYKCNNHDVSYLEDVYCKWSSSKLTVKVSKDTIFRRILVDIAYRLVTGGRYDVDGYSVKK